MARRPYVPLFREIATSERLADLRSDRDRLFYLMLLPQCDAWGRVTASPRALNALVWPILELGSGAASKALAELARVGLVEFHEADGVSWVQIPDWDEKAGSVGKKQDRGASKYPDPTPETRTGGPENATPNQPPNHPQVTPESPPADLAVTPPERREEREERRTTPDARAREAGSPGGSGGGGGSSGGGEDPASEDAAKRTLFGVLCPAGLSASPEMLEHLRGPAWFGGVIADAEVEAQLAALAADAAAKANPGGWLRAALRNGHAALRAEKLTAPSAKPVTRGSPREAPEEFAARLAALADALEAQAQHWQAKGEPDRATHCREEAARTRRAAERSAAPAVGVGG